MMIMIISPFGQVYDDEYDNKPVFFFFFSLGVRDVFTTAYVLHTPVVIEDILGFTPPRSRDVLVVWVGSTLYMLCLVDETMRLCYDVPILPSKQAEAWGSQGPILLNVN